MGHGPGSFQLWGRRLASPRTSGVRLERRQCGEAGAVTTGPGYLEPWDSWPRC